MATRVGPSALGWVTSEVKRTKTPYVVGSVHGVGRRVSARNCYVGACRLDLFWPGVFAGTVAAETYSEVAPVSRSRKKHPITGITCARSDKPFKVSEHRAERRAVRQAVHVGTEPPHSLEYGNPWASPKDGRTDWTGSDYERKARRK